MISVHMINADVIAGLRSLPAESVDCVVTSPPYWGLRSYLPADHPDKPREMGSERTLGEHLKTMVAVFDEVRRVMKKDATLWLNYGDCYASAPNGRSAADAKAAGTDDRTFRDKPFSTVGPIYQPDAEAGDRRGKSGNKGSEGQAARTGRIGGGGSLKPKDLCMVANRFAIALQDAGWWVRSEIVWAKPNPMPDSSGRYRPSSAHEKIFLLTKSAKSYYDANAGRMMATQDERSNGYPGSNGDGVRKRSTVGNYKMPDGWNTGPGAHRSFHPEGREKGQKADKQRGHSRRHAGFNDRWDQMTREEQRANGRLLRNVEASPWECAGVEDQHWIGPHVWLIATKGFKGAHFATFPPALAATCVAIGCKPGGVVLDPFGGAGTTGMVAARMQRPAVLIELSADYAELAAARIRDDLGFIVDCTVETPALKTEAA